MLNLLGNILFVLWISISVIFISYALIELTLLLIMIFSKKKNETIELEDYPLVTIQLPVYNEKYVIERLITAVCVLDYPKEKLEIQVLDDSTDETVRIANDIITKYQEEGFRISHTRRVDRVGFKAGALEYGMDHCEGEFIAIFDADFVPSPDFLLKTLPFFTNEKIGAVQTRWSHLNEDFSFITRAQAIMLNTHFSVEQLGRNASEAFINFNGTAGVWRRSCIEDAGGWQADTLTEDLDLSFRAQIKGWKFKYLFDVASPSELPLTMDAYRTQQYRWSKGAAECVRKNFKTLIQSKETSFWAKLIGSAHLLNSSIYFISLLLMILAPTVGILKKLGYISLSTHFEFGFLSSLSMFILPILFAFGYFFPSQKRWRDFLLFPVNLFCFLCINIGITPFMVLGVLEGYRGKKTEFVRTPKFNKIIGSIKLDKEGYAQKNESNIFIWEFALFLFGISLLVLGGSFTDFTATLFGILITIGLGLKIFFAKTVFRF
jgi:cellulose synthase/poly-beta-1,6-N-acetylglucosamine synthase-like glycosyltransferase